MVRILQRQLRHCIFWHTLLKRYSLFYVIMLHAIFPFSKRRASCAFSDRVLRIRPESRDYLLACSIWLQTSEVPLPNNAKEMCCSPHASLIILLSQPSPPMSTHYARYLTETARPKCPHQFLADHSPVARTLVNLSIWVELSIRFQKACASLEHAIRIREELKLRRIMETGLM